MSLIDLEVYPFVKNKYYIITFDPCLVNAESIENICSDPKFKINGIFIPVKEGGNLKSINFESIRAIEDWIKEIKNESI